MKHLNWFLREAAFFDASDGAGSLEFSSTTCELSLLRKYLVILSQSEKSNRWEFGIDHKGE